MILDLAISEVQQIVGWRSDRVAEITRALAYAQEELEKPGLTFPYWLEGTVSFTTAVGTLAYTIPANFIQEREVRDGGVIYLTGGVLVSRIVFLNKLSLRDAHQRYFGAWPQSGASDPTEQINITGIPRDYVFDGGTIIFYPKPDKVYSVFVNSWVRAAAQTIGQANAWLTNAPWVLIGMAAKKLASDIQYSAGVSAADAILSEAKANMFRSVIHRQEAGRSRSMGSRL